MHAPEQQTETPLARTRSIRRPSSFTRPLVIVPPPSPPRPYSTVDANQSSFPFPHAHITIPRRPSSTFSSQSLAPSSDPTRPPIPHRGSSITSSRSAQALLPQSGSSQSFASTSNYIAFPAHSAASPCGSRSRPRRTSSCAPSLPPPPLTSSSSPPPLPRSVTTSMHSTRHARYASSDSSGDEEPQPRERYPRREMQTSSVSLARRMSGLPATPGEAISIPAGGRGPAAAKGFVPGSVGSTREGMPLVGSEVVWEQEESGGWRRGSVVQVGEERATRKEGPNWGGRKSPPSLFPPMDRMSSGLDGTGAFPSKAGSPKSASFISLSSWRNSLAFDVFPAPPRGHGKAPSSSPDLGSGVSSASASPILPAATKYPGNLPTPSPSPLQSAFPSPSLGFPSPPLGYPMTPPPQQPYRSVTSTPSSLSASSATTSIASSGPTSPPSLLHAAQLRAPTAIVVQTPADAVFSPSPQSASDLETQRREYILKHTGKGRLESQCAVFSTPSSTPSSIFPSTKPARTNFLRNPQKPPYLTVRPSTADSMSSMSSFISEAPSRGVGAVGPDGLVKADVGRRRVSPAPWEEEEAPASPSSDEDILDRMVQAQQKAVFEPELKERRRRSISPLAIAAVAGAVGLGLASWRERGDSTSTKSSDPFGSSEDDPFLSPTSPISEGLETIRKSLDAPLLSDSASYDDLRRDSVAFSEASGYSEYTDARAETPVLSSTSTPSEHEDSEDEPPPVDQTPLLAFTKQQTSLWVLDTIASVGASEDRMSIIGEEEEVEPQPAPESTSSCASSGPPEQVFPRPATPPASPPPISLLTIPFATRPSLSRKGSRNAKNLFIDPNLLSPTHSAGAHPFPFPPISNVAGSSLEPPSPLIPPTPFTPYSAMSSIFPASAFPQPPSRSPKSPRWPTSPFGNRGFTGMFRKPSTPGFTKGVGISSESLNLSSSSSASLPSSPGQSFAPPTPSVVVGHHDDGRRLSSGSWGSSESSEVLLDVADRRRDGVRMTSGEDGVAATPEVTKLVGMLEQFARDEKVRLQGIASSRRVSLSS